MTLKNYLFILLNSEKVVLTSEGKEKEVKEENIDAQNPPKYELCEDMANMTYLSEATVVHNLKGNVFNKFIDEVINGD